MPSSTIKHYSRDRRSGSVSRSSKVMGQNLAHLRDMGLRRLAHLLEDQLRELSRMVLALRSRGTCRRTKTTTWEMSQSSSPTEMGASSSQRLVQASMLRLAG